MGTKNMHLLECGFREKLEAMNVDKILAHIYPDEAIGAQELHEIADALINSDFTSVELSDLADQILRSVSEREET
jgi:hypothetical protein